MKKILRLMLVSIISFLFTAMPVMAANNVEKVPDIIPIEGGYLQRVSEAIVTQGSPTLRYQYTVITEGGNVNVRSKPSTSASIRGQYKNGAIIDIPYKQESGIGPWSYSYGKDANTGKDIEGYIHDDYWG